jgi:hypothetical protein
MYAANDAAAGNANADDDIVEGEVIDEPAR